MASPNTTVFFQYNVIIQSRDDPINIFSFQTSRTIDKFILVFQSCVLVIGLSTNVVNGVVFWRQGLRDRMNLCLFCLSLADLCYLVTILLVLTVNSIMALINMNLAAVYSVKSLTYGLGFIFGTAALSRLISMVIAVERCLCVVFPLQASSLIRTRTMAGLLAVILVFVMLCYSAMPLCKEIRCFTDNVTSQESCVTTYSSLYKQNYLMWQIIYNVLPRVVVPVGTFLIIVVSTSITVVRLRAAMSWRQQTSSSRGDPQDQQMALTKMLVVISCIDITCSTPSVIQTIMEIYRSDFLTGGPLYNLLRTTGSLSTVFVCINSSVNFFVYLTRSTRYRLELQLLCCFRLSKVKQINSITSTERTSVR